MGFRLDGDGVVVEEAEERRLEPRGDLLLLSLGRFEARVRVRVRVRARVRVRVRVFGY